MSDFKKFKEELPSKEKFIVPWPTEKIVTKNMKMFLMFAKKFKMKIMKDYHNLYLKCDVFLLVNVFEKFRNNSLKDYGLMLKMTKIELELIPDPGTYIFFEKGTRDGISYISNR